MSDDAQQGTGPSLHANLTAAAAEMTRGGMDSGALTQLAFAEMARFLEAQPWTDEAKSHFIFAAAWGLALRCALATGGNINEQAALVASGMASPGDFPDLAKIMREHAH